jgi:hypothetical protein
MIFFSRGSRGSQRKKGRRKNVFGQEGMNKRIRFFVHFDAISYEFNHLARIGNLLFGGKQAFLKPLRPLNIPLQPHPSIFGIPMHPQSDLANDECETNQNKLVSRNAKWPNMQPST